jgi:hypothetical protein
VEASIPDDRLKMRIFNGSLISFKALVCMLSAPWQTKPAGSIEKKKKKKQRFYLQVSLFEHTYIHINRFQEYNATIDFYWSPLLVESNSDNPIIHRVEYRIIRADRIEKHASVWRDADVIVFNSYLWWRKQKDDMRMKVM